MMNIESLNQAKANLREWWGEGAEKVIQVCEDEPKLEIPYKDFLKTCTACGGNWGGMLLSGIRDHSRAIWDAIPDNMGDHAFFALCNVLQLMGVDTSM